jgi:hypothetical protein
LTQKPSETFWLLKLTRNQVLSLVALIILRRRRKKKEEEKE